MVTSKFPAQMSRNALNVSICAAIMMSMEMKAVLQIYIETHIQADERVLIDIYIGLMGFINIIWCKSIQQKQITEF